MFRYSFSEAIPTFFNALKVILSLSHCIKFSPMIDYSAHYFGKIVVAQIFDRFVG